MTRTSQKSSQILQLGQTQTMLQNIAGANTAALRKETKIRSAAVQTTALLMSFFTHYTVVYLYSRSF